MNIKEREKEGNVVKLLHNVEEREMQEGMIEYLNNVTTPP
jgi:hypothetical protein